MKTNSGVTKVLVSALCLAVALAASAAAGEAIRGVEDLKGKRIGVLEGSLNGDALRAKVPEFVLLYFMTTTDLVGALRSGEVAAIAHDTPTLMVLAATDPSFALLPGAIQEDNYALAVNKDNAQLAEQVNAVLREFRNDGTLEALHKKWVSGPAAGKVMPKDVGVSGERVLRFAIADMGMPFAYLDAEGNLIGHDVELGMRIADKLGMRLHIQEMLFAHLLQSVSMGTVDLAGSAITVTADRAEQVRFSIPYYRGGVAVMIKK